MPLSAQRHHLLRKRLDLFTRMLQGLHDGDVRALHQTRVASRRLREIVPVLGLDGDVAEKLGRRLKQVTRRLGVLRELDVLAELIAERHESERDSRRALELVESSVAQQRRQLREALPERVSPGRLMRLSARLKRAAKQVKHAEADTDAAPRRAPTHGWRWALEARVARRAHVLETTIEDAGAVYLPDRLHQVRIAIKKLRYAAELATEASGRRSTPELRRLKAAQDLLGRVHDLQGLIEWTRRTQASLATPDLGAWRALESLAVALDTDCRRLHARYMRTRPGLLVAAAQASGPARVPSAARKMAG